MVRGPRSLRLRLQIWHALILLGVIAGFGSVLYHQVVKSRWDEVDANLLSAGRLLEGALRNLPRPVLDSLAQDLGSHRGGRPGPPPRTNDMDRGPAPAGPPPDRRPPQAGSPSAFVLPGKAQLEWDSSAQLSDQQSLRDSVGQVIELPDRLPDQLAEGPGRAYYVIWQADGTILKQSDVPYPDPARPEQHELNRLPRMVHQREGGPLREVFVRGPNDTLICVGRPVGREVNQMWTLAGQLLIAGLTILGAGLCGGWWLSGRAIQPIERMTQTASGIDANNLSARIDLTNVDLELERLGSVLNGMLGRIDDAFQTQRRFAADASHELRTPLAIMLSTIELSLSKPRQPEEYQQQLLKCQRAAQRMHSLVTSLLQLTRSDEAPASSNSTAVDLMTVVTESLDPLRDLASAQQITLHESLTSTIVQGNALELGQVVTNLLTNAIVYNRPSGEVFVQLARQGADAVLTVRDTGIGISAEDLPHIFERFYRVDKARSQSLATTGAPSGHGLGLAICRAIITAHGGSITAESQPEQGTRLTVRLAASHHGA